MSEEVELHIANVAGAYCQLITTSDRLIGGPRLWAQFECAVDAYRCYGRHQVCGVIERVNELAAAKLLLSDASLGTSVIEYEPQIVASGPKFDFAVAEATGTTLYVEAKTVAPRTEDSEQNWQKTLQRKKRLSPGNQYVVSKQWMGATIFGNSFAARSSFRAYALETESKLSAHGAIRPGRAILIFCGSGFGWHIDELEDFADFYRTGCHRADDPFAMMEQHAMKEEASLAPARTLDGFAALVRGHGDIDPTKCVYPVRGPIIC